MPKSMSCARCGRKMWQGNGTLPEGQATCHPCRRILRPRTKAPAFQPELRPCKNCGAMFEADRATKVYCNPECRQSRPRTGAHHNRATVAERGYGAPHTKLRRKWKPMVEAGKVDCHAVVCVMPSRWIEPGTPWDLGHTEDRTAWTGPEHQRCNRVDGAKRSPQAGWNVGHVEKACETCGHAFVTRYRMQRYCGKACRPKPLPAANKSRRTPESRACSMCSVQFMAERNQRYCPEHRGYQPRVRAIECVVCGRSADARQGGKLYCSPACSRRAYRRSTAGQQQRSNAGRRRRARLRDEGRGPSISSVASA